MEHTLMYKSSQTLVEHTLIYKSVFRMAGIRLPGSIGCPFFFLLHFFLSIWFGYIWSQNVLFKPKIFLNILVGKIASSSAFLKWIIIGVQHLYIGFAYASFSLSRLIYWLIPTFKTFYIWYVHCFFPQDYLVQVVPHILSQMSLLHCYLYKFMHVAV